ncbi:restriction endonuclease subunit S [Psychrobacter sp. CCUG 69069]|uniref:Restriction endonuclease subunit S n=1 Tax=Psychrobacter namhaensis TaxID=292734 RepID=A0ABW8LB02_9GAMM|nr:restriction endonuclease subunit S [Psychrobacter sp. CCUG 69069]MCD1278850.1 restriction endonuclease subunit S [Psychrobacter sp. CCUG 69069]
MAKYQQYEQYKESGVEWLGNIPSHWEVVPIKHLAILNPKKSTLSQDLMSDECSFVPMEKLKFNSLVLNEKKVIKDVYDGYTYFENEDILVAKVTPCFENNNTTIARDLINGVGFGSSEIFVLRVNDKVNNRYLFYRLLETIFISVATAAMTGAGGLRRVPAEIINTYPIAVPDINEQTQIANFLDHETAQIDTLIEKQQTLIQLLKEKRQAVISHAVTKGLSPDAPMKDSGVEWLGEVPEHWIVKRLKYISPKVGVGLVINPSTYTQDEGVYFIFGGDVKAFSFDLTKTRRISQKNSDILKPSQLHHRDLVSIRVGYPGVTAVVTEELEGANCASIIIIRRGQFNSDWLCAAMNIWVGKQQVNNASYGAAQKQFNVSDAIEFIFPVPPESEQNDIAVYVEESLKKFDELSNKAQLQIELLRERRTALISAAVTGKIDVRGWQGTEVDAL